jgi:hypothetical protein
MKKKCPSVTQDGYKIYWDYGHITSKGAEFFAKIFEKNIAIFEILKLNS